MNNQDKKFKPLSHDNLEVKQWLLKVARDLMNKQGFENGLAASMIYSSFTEYLAENLLRNLRYFTYQGTYNQYAGIIFIDETKTSKSKKTLGQSIGEIEKFNFPDREGILECLGKINDARNRIMHEFSKSDFEGIKKMVTEDIFLIRNKTEELVNKIDVIYAGLQKVLNPNLTTNTPVVTDSKKEK